MAENYDGQLDFEIAFLEGVLEAWPDNTDALKAIAENYTKRGLYEKGLKADRKLSCLLPLDAVVHYNLACSYALVGDGEKALIALKLAVELGYDDVKHMLRDADLESIRLDPRFDELVQELKAKMKGGSTAGGEETR